MLLLFLEFNVDDPIEIHDETTSPLRHNTEAAEPLTPHKSAPIVQNPTTEELKSISSSQLSPTQNRKRSAFTIDNIIGRDTITRHEDDFQPESKKSKADIFDSIPSPPPKISDMHSPAMMGMPGFHPHLYNPFLLNLAAARGPAAAFPGSSPRPSLGLLPMMSPFLHPGLAGALPGSQSVL